MGEQGAALKSPEEIEKEAQTFSVLTFADILRALKEHPDWVEEIRRIILTHELMELPKRFEEFLKEFQELKGEVQGLKERVDKLEVDVEILKKDVEVLKQDMKDVKDELGRLKGSDFERRVRERFYAYFGRVLKGARLFEPRELVSIFERAEEEGKIDIEKLEDLLNLGLVVEGRIRNTNKEVVLAVEVSYTVYEKDIKRVVDRASLLGFLLEKEVIPTVIGVSVKERVRKLAEEKAALLIKVGE